MKLDFKVVPLYESRPRNPNKLPDVQPRMIRAIKNALNARTWPNNVTILWDQDQDPEADRRAEEPALYTGEKMRGRGRICRNGAVDVMLRDEIAMIVPLLVEFEKDLDPKKLWGDSGIAVDSDRHVPSNVYCDDLRADGHQPSYYLKGTLLVIVTICGSRKVEQLQAIGKRLRERFRLPTPEVRDVIICAGETEEAALAEFMRILAREFGAV